MMELFRLAKRPPDWSREIQAFATKTLFHEPAWLDFVQTCRRRGRFEYFEIRQNGLKVGYFCALRVRKFMFRVYGSPLPEAGMYMGPLVNDGVNQRELVEALVGWCRSNGIASLELTNDWLDPEIMKSSGFQTAASVTHVCPLDTEEKAVWERLRGTCRTRIRKAWKNGLAGEIASDPHVAEEFYRYFTEVLRLKGRRPQYGVDRARSLLERLGPADRLFAVRIRRRGEVIGAGFYPHDDRAMYYWDGASDPAHLDLCPNELLHWTAMQAAVARRIPIFNIGGAPIPSRFTRKFGGDDVPYNRYRRNFIPFLETARSVYHYFVTDRLPGVSAKRPA
jgi:hypothetical protein